MPLPGEIARQRQGARPEVVFCPKPNGATKMIFIGLCTKFLMLTKWWLMLIRTALKRPCYLATPRERGWSRAMKPRSRGVAR